MNLETYYRMLVHDPDGNLVKDTGLLLAGSYVIQFLEQLEAFLDADLTKEATDVVGAESLVSGGVAAPAFGRMDAPALNDVYGVVVGTNAGTTAEDNLNYALDTKIAHSGIGAAGCMNYQAVTFVAPHEDAGNIDLHITRTFLNETGGGITVKEIGIICKNSVDTKYHLLLRDVVADELVNDGETLTVVYTLRTTV